MLHRSNTNPTDRAHQGPPTTAKTFTRNNNRVSNHATAGKQQRVGNHLAELRSCIDETRVTHHKPELPTSPLASFEITQKEGIDARL